MKRKKHANFGWHSVLISGIVLLFLAACQTAYASTSVPTSGATAIPQAGPTSTASPAAPANPTPSPKALLPVTGSNPTPSPTAPRAVPYFSHVILFVLENKEYTSVVGNTQMPYLNSLARQYTLLTHYYAIAHPSLPNYISLIGGDTMGITSDCSTCWVNSPNLADQIESAGLTWRTYQESMPSPCDSSDNSLYAHRHDPFIYFDDIRTNAARCQKDIVPLTALDSDLAKNTLPNFSLVVPNLCNSSHNCALGVTDAWLNTWVTKVMASQAYDQHTLIVVTWDEGQSNQTCCGFSSGGGRVATVLISPLVRQGFKDNTTYTHYSLLKTIAESWDLQALGHAADAQESLITTPFEK